MPSRLIYRVTKSGANRPDAMPWSLLMQVVGQPDDCSMTAQRRGNQSYGSQMLADKS
jgi:hypothetical protein